MKKPKWPIVCICIGVLFAAVAASGKITNGAMAWVIAFLLCGLGIWKVLPQHSESKTPLKKEQQPSAAALQDSYTFVNFKVAGTTFDTDGVSRQSYLRKIKFGDPPFENQGSLDVHIRPTKFKGEDAIECLVNGILIGYVPKERIPEVQEAIRHPGAEVSGFEVTGGGKEYNYGANIAVKFRR